MLKAQQDRSQLQFFCLENSVDANSPVRVIDAFVDSLDLAELGFVIKGQVKNGAPAFRAGDLLKLYFYGYSNRVRSCRLLERETKTNIEAMWLLRGAKPCYKTINNFRNDNSKALRATFRCFNQFLLGEGLFDRSKVAIDGSKFRAQNSKKNNYSEKKIEQHLDYIDRKTEAYLKALADNEKGEDYTEMEQEMTEHIADQLDHLQERKDKYEGIKAQYQEAREAGQTQVSTVDPDARALPKKMNIVEVGYNLVTAAEGKNYFITNFNLLNENDTYALSKIGVEAASFLRPPTNPTAPFLVIADKGFDTGHELKICSEQGIDTLVAPRKRLTNKKNPRFAKDKFAYHEEQDCYECPQGEMLHTNGRLYQKKAYGQHRAPYQFKRYTCSINVCRNCPFKEDCVGQANLKKSKGRHLERTEYEPYIEENKRRYEVSKAIYRERQSMVEHQFGTIKRQWGFDHTLLKTKEKVAGEFALILTCYNLRRAISVLGTKELIQRLKDAFGSLFSAFRSVLGSFLAFFWKSGFGMKKFNLLFSSLQWRYVV